MLLFRRRRILSRTLVELYYPDHVLGDRRQLADEIKVTLRKVCQFQWPRDLRRRSAAARLLRLWVLIPPGARMSVCLSACVLCVVRGLCEGADHSSRGVLPSVVRHRV
jgi:hypothetical protein